MLSISEIRYKISDLKSRYLKDSISPHFLGGILEEMLGYTWWSGSPGNFKLESLKVGSLEAQQLVIDRLLSLDTDTILTESDIIDAVTDNLDGTYTLRLRERWPGYVTAQIEHNILRGFYQNIMPPLQPGSGTQTIRDAAAWNSWMNVLSVDADTNTIVVTMYPDADTPAGKNHLPVPGMKFARWGNSGDSSDERYALRQTCVWLSSSEGTVSKYCRVTKPILFYGNIAASFGTLPDFLAGIDDRINPGDNGIFSDTIVARRLILLDEAQRPVYTTVDRGLWTPGARYFDGTEPNFNGVYERSLVWHLGHGWLCNSGGVASATNAPAWNTSYWTHALGDTELRLSLEGFPPAINPRSFKINGSVRATRGDIDVTDLIADADITWSRYSEDAQGNRRTASDNAWDARHSATAKEITLTPDDLDAQNGLPPVCIFKVTALLRDTPAAEPEILTASKGFGG